ncbi:MAG: hypothetical protein ACOYMN_16225 [Roseimicrobium sp.]
MTFWTGKVTGKLEAGGLQNVVPNSSSRRDSGWTPRLRKPRTADDDIGVGLMGKPQRIDDSAKAVAARLTSPPVPQ